MCIIHKGFRGFRAASPASNLGNNLIGLKYVLPYEIIQSQLAATLTRPKEWIQEKHKIPTGAISVLNTLGETKDYHVHTHMIISWGGHNQEFKSL